MRIFLLAGQSNMQGCGNFGTHSELNDARLFNYKNGKWQNAQEPLHDYTCKLWPDGGAGLAMSFGLRLLETFPEWQIGFIPCAVGGSRLEQWQPQAELFKNAIAKTKQALAACHGELSGILWHQGEADAKTQATAETYAERFAQTINGFRSELRNELLPVITGELGDFLVRNPDLKHYKIVNNALKQIATAVVSADNLTDNDRNDNTHFDTKSLRELGIRYAEAYIKL
jgi:enoyl-CoA hydratase/carnithine racemase